MQYASPWSRFLSACADLSILRLLLDFGSLAVPSAWFANKAIVFAAFAVCILITYFVSRAFLNGQTLGMWLFGYRVVKNVKGKRLTWFEEILRFASQWISALLFFLPFTYSLFNKKAVHFSDLVVDSAPQKTEARFADARPFQRFLGLLLIIMAINGILAVVQKVPAIDLFGRIIKGEVARGIHISLVLSCALAGIFNIYGKRRSIHIAAALYFVLSFSAVWSLTIFDIYQRRVSQNLQETLTSANAQTSQPISEKMLKGMVQETDRYMQGNLKSATKANLVLNAICLFYMLYLIFVRQLEPLVKKGRSFAVSVIRKIRSLIKQGAQEKGNENT